MDVWNYFALVFLLTWDVCISMTLKPSGLVYFINLERKITLPGAAMKSKE